MFGPEALSVMLPKPVNALPLVSVNVSAFAELKTNRQTTAPKSTRNMSDSFWGETLGLDFEGTREVYKIVNLVVNANLR